MSKYHRKLEIALFLMIFTVSERENACILPDGIVVKNFHKINVHSADQFLSNDDPIGFELKITNKQYRFDLMGWLEKDQTDLCQKSNYFGIHLRFLRKFHLTHFLNLEGIIQFLGILAYDHQFQITITNLNAIEVDVCIGVNYYGKELVNLNLINYTINIFNTVFDFRLEGKPVKSCGDMIDANKTEPRSLFQISPREENIEMFWLNNRYIRRMCPLLFKNNRISKLTINGMHNTFYKQNVLTFTNDTFDNLDSKIVFLKLFKSENLVVDEKLLNPSVFANLQGNF